MAGGSRYGPLLDAVRGVRWPARRAVRVGLSGTHRSRARGASAEFSEYRMYRQGDDPRRIDWKLLGRSDRTYIRLADDRAILGTAVIVDASASMAFPPATLAKWVLARQLAVALAAVAHAAGDPVGLLAVSSAGRHELPARARRGVVAEMARMLDGVTPSGTEPLGPALQRARAPRLAIVSDFLGDADAMLRAAAERMAGGGEVHAVHVVAAEEIDPPRRSLLATDPERPDLVRPLVATTRDDYLAAFGAWRDELARRWRAAGVSFTMVVTDEPPEHAVRRIVAPPGGAAAALA